MMPNSVPGVRRWRESEHDAYNQTSRRDDCAGCDRGVRCRMAKLSQPGADDSAACPRSHRDAFAAGRHRSSVPRAQRAGRHCQLSICGCIEWVDPREYGGREIVRVDRSGPNGAVRIVPEAELQRKADQAYFKDTIKLRAGEIHVSALDLNEENGGVETSRMPTLRVAT